MPEFAALSVLVLAWDEAAPTLRTLIEAAPAVGSLLVLLPPIGPAPAAEATPTTQALTVAVYPTPPVPAEPAAATPTDTKSPAATASPRLAKPPTEASTTAAAPAPPVAGVPAGPPAVPTIPAVRLLRLPAGLPPTSQRAGTYQVPAAPYLGATPVTAPPLTTPATSPKAVVSTPPLIAEAYTTTDLAAVTSTPDAGQAAQAASPLPTTTNAPATAAPTTENEATIPLAEETQPAEAALPLADMAFRADEIVDPDPEQELQAAPLETPAATPADAPALLDLPPLPNHGPFGQRLPPTEPAAYLPAPRLAAPDDHEGELILSEEPVARPAPQYSAPDLNNQIIRYARQAVPTALAEGPFQVLYAPAWPTWLAAIELRQRSGRPLVLHLPALAAGRQPADTAAGWPAEIQRQALRQADLVLVDTYALARRLRRELGLANGAVRVVTPGDAGAIARALRRVHRR